MMVHFMVRVAMIPSVNGDGGNDVITGGFGNDVISGGSGHDIIVGTQSDELYTLVAVIVVIIQPTIRTLTNSPCDDSNMLGYLVLTRYFTITKHH